MFLCLLIKAEILQSNIVHSTKKVLLVLRNPNGKDILQAHFFNMDRQYFFILSPPPIIVNLVVTPHKDPFEMKVLLSYSLKSFSEIENAIYCVRQDKHLLRPEATLYWIYSSIWFYGIWNKNILAFYLLWERTLWIRFYFFLITQSCLCFSAFIFFFVKSDVQKCTSPESMPLLIDDRVS